jgi:excisionase family DNA binding protein
MRNANRRNSRPGDSAPSFLNVRQVAELMGLSMKTVWRLLASGELPFHRFGRSIRISEADYANFAVKRRAE